MEKIDFFKEAKNKRTEKAPLIKTDKANLNIFFVIFSIEKSLVLGGWMSGWMEVKAVLKIAYSNQKALKHLMERKLEKIAKRFFIKLCF